jgi:hypothetical protein
MFDRYRSNVKKGKRTKTEAASQLRSVLLAAEAQFRSKSNSVHSRIRHRNHTQQRNVCHDRTKSERQPKKPMSAADQLNAVNVAAGAHWSSKQTPRTRVKSSSAAITLQKLETMLRHANVPSADGYKEITPAKFTEVRELKNLQKPEIIKYEQLLPLEDAINDAMEGSAL